MVIVIHFFSKHLLSIECNNDCEVLPWQNKKKRLIFISISRSSSVWVIAGYHTHRRGRLETHTNPNTYIHTQRQELREDRSVSGSLFCSLLIGSISEQGITRLYREGNIVLPGPHHRVSYHDAVIQSIKQHP